MIRWGSVSKSHVTSIQMMKPAFFQLLLYQILWIVIFVTDTATYVSFSPPPAITYAYKTFALLQFVSSLQTMATSKILENLLLPQPSKTRAAADLLPLPPKLQDELANLVRLRMSTTLKNYWTGKFIEKDYIYTYWNKRYFQAVRQWSLGPNFHCSHQQPTNFNPKVWPGCVATAAAVK